MDTHEHESMPAARRPGKPATVAAARRGRRTASLAVIVCCARALESFAAAAPDHGDEHLHVPLRTNAEMTWQELIDRTVEHYPRFVELAAREAEAGALASRARSWLSSRPSLAMRYYTDQVSDDNGQREYEVTLDLPLWRSGQRQAAMSLGRAAAAGSEAAAMALRHDVTGLLRMALWDIQAAEIGLDVARDGVRVAENLEAVIQRRYEAGELPLSETLLMRSTTLEREAAVVEAEARRVDADRAYQSLTGLTERPAEFAETLSEREDVDSAHPWLVLADADLARARADTELTRQAAKGAPVLSVGPRREVAPFGAYTADTLGLALILPFGGKSHPTAAALASARAAAQADAERRALLRRLDLDLHEARHGLLVIEQSLDLAKRRLELADRSFAMSRQAFAQGEMTLLELLRREETALSTRREVAALEVERQRAIAEINQAIGVSP